MNDKGMSERKNWTTEMDEYFSALYPEHTNKQIAELTGWSIYTIRWRARKLGLKKTEDCRNTCWHKTGWTKEKVQFLKDNFFKMTNRELAAAVGVNLTVLRNKTRQLGLRNYELEYWTPEQTEFLKAHYRAIGDTEIAERLQEKWPRTKVWTRKHIKKKRDYLKLFRTPEEVARIIASHSQPGGRSDTIRKNSAAYNLPDRYVANTLFRKNPELKEEVIQHHPEMIEIKRKQLRLQKEIKKGRDV